MLSSVRSTIDPVVSLLELAKNGYWTGDHFIPGCYVKPGDGDTISFSGLIACYRVVNRSEKSSKVHVTIGYDNGKFLDLTMNINHNSSFCAIEHQLKRHYYIAGKADRNRIIGEPKTF